ncbi:MAG: UDP-N-acetylglucosamine 2-epimerase [Alphaproteobacteria bacterium]|nr:UDP-N-acetylglucosamine 2-epimerase [Alphaproteobacteria bacterium]
MKKISVPLTNRTNYSKLKLVLLSLNKYSDIQISIVASSTVLLERYGKAFEDVIKDGFNIDQKIDCVLMNDSHESMAKTVGMSIIEHATYFSSAKPDMLLVVGDRFDMMAPVVAASMMNIPIAHIQGGEVSGTIDNVVRDVFTNFASMHFVATEKSAQKLHQLGIKDDVVFDYGCPAVEYISKIDIGDSFDAARLMKSFKRVIDIGRDEKYFLVMVHPDTTNRHDVNMDKILNVVEKFGIKALIFYPNVDAHNSEIVASIAKHKNNENFFMIRHMPIDGFVHAMAHCCCMIGNSSAGIREASSFGTPVINVGYRQVNRERNSNVIDIGDDYDLLDAMIKKHMDYKFDRSNIYLKPDCSRMIAKEIAGFLGIKG